MRTDHALKSPMTTTTAQRPSDQTNVVRETTRILAGDMVLYVALGALVLAAWRFTQLGLFKAGDDVGYWLGVAGGVTMLLLFTYPLRKHLAFMRNWGATKWWFWVHMVLGVAGPLLILLHSTFHVGSLNAGVALYSMVVVAVSGVIGRFVYQRVHRGLHGERTTLRQLQVRAGFMQTEARSRLQFAPKVEERLQAFEQAHLSTDLGWRAMGRQLVLLPLQQQICYLGCIMELREPLSAVARKRGWNEEEHAKRRRLARKLVRRYLSGVVRVAQFTAYERLFALWHMAHVPFVYILVVSAIAHVIAVHAY